MTADPILRVAVVASSGTLDVAASRASVEAIASPPPGTRAVLFEHPGVNFCVGGDVVQFARADDVGSFIADVAHQFHQVIRTMMTSPLPVVAGVQGWAAGAGMSLACAADVVVAGESTRFRPAYPALGFTPDGGLTWTLPRLVGRARAMDILLNDRVIDSAEALRLGLVSTVVPDDDVHSAAAAVAASLATRSAGALAGIKRLVSDGWSRSLDDQLGAEATSIAARAASPDGREGVHAFLERRSPAFDN